MNITQLIHRFIGKELIQAQNGYTAARPGPASVSADPIEQRRGIDIYDRLMTDPVICGSVNLLMLKTVGEGIRLTPSGGSREICDFFSEMLKGFSVPLSEVLRQALLALIYGSAVFEKIFAYKDGLYTIADLKYKPRSAYRLLLDSSNTIKGITGPEGDENSVPAEKLFVFTHRSLSGDPRGTSVLGPCYPLWRMKRDKINEYCKYLSLYASPALIGTLPPDAACFDRQGFLKDISALRSGGTMVVSHGTEISPISVQNNESLYLGFIDFCNREMVTAILGSTRATMEARHGSRADSETSLELIGDQVRFYRQNLAEAIKDQLLYPIAEANWGPEAAGKYTPIPEFIPDNNEDVIAYGTMVAELCRAGYTDKSQQPGIDARLKLPARNGQDSEAGRGSGLF